MSSAFRVREWSGYALHSYYGGLILDTGPGVVLHVGVLVSVCRLRLQLGWLTQLCGDYSGQGFLEAGNYDFKKEQV